MISASLPNPGCWALLSCCPEVYGQVKVRDGFEETQQLRRESKSLGSLCGQGLVHNKILRLVSSHLHGSPCADRQHGPDFSNGFEKCSSFPV